MEVSRAEMMRLVSVARACGAPSRSRRGNIRNVAQRQVPQAWRWQPSAGVTIEQRVTPLDRVGCYVPGGRYPLPSSLLMTAIPARVGRRERRRRRVPAARSDGHAGGARGRRRVDCSASAARTRSPRSPTAPRRFRASTRSSGPGNAYVAAAKALVSRDCAIDFLRRAQRDRHRVGHGTRGLDRRRPDRTGRTRSGCASDPADAIATARCAPWRRSARGSCRRRSRAQRLCRNGGDRRHTVASTKRSRSASASRPSTSSATTTAWPRRLTSGGDGLRRRVQRAGSRRLHDRLEPRPADERRRARTRRAECRRFRARVDGAADHAHVA